MTNSGIYLNLNYRKNVQKRLSYADSVMQTAGTYPEEKRKLFENKMGESCTKSLNSFFYPVENGIINTDEHDQNADQYFQNLFTNLETILTRKTKNYQQIHSLLQTEMPMLFRLARNYEDERLEWKPSLYYHLLWDSRMFPEKERDERDKLEEELESFLSELKSQIEPAVSQKEWKYLEGILKFKLAQILYKSRLLLTEDEYQLVMQECEKTEEVIQKCKETDNNIPERLFVCKMHLHFIKQKIYVRRSTILETEQHQNQLSEQLDVMLYKQASNEQGQEAQKIYAVKTALEDNLKEIQNALEDRKNKTGHSYREFFAQYYFFKGEYYYSCLLYNWKDPLKSEFEQCGHTSMEPAENAEKFLKKALESYNSYPLQYEIQQADVLRQLADLYCLKSKSLREVRKDTARQKEYMDRCYDMLIDAYIRYRNNFELHGIADVLCSMRCAEPPESEKILQPCNEDSIQNMVKQIDALQQQIEQVCQQYRGTLQHVTDASHNKNHLACYCKEILHICKQQEDISSSRRSVGHRSPDSFLKLAKDLYEYLGDECSLHVLSVFPCEMP